LITSRQNPKLKLVHALLGRSKERREEGAFVAEGVRLLEEARSCGWPTRFVLYSDGLSERGLALVRELRAAGTDVEEVSADLMQSLSETEAPQGLLAILEEQDLPLPASLDFLLIPDRIRDPGNLGTLIRSAAAAGVQAVLLPPETTDAFAPKVIRAAMGAHFRMPLLRLDWDAIRQFCESAHLNVYLADMGAPPCWEVDLRAPLALIVGSEAGGGGEAARSLAAGSISVPMPGGTESLNAGVAGSILLFEIVRQRTRQ
jgi:TrmH family RNA methyltransferase